MKRGLFMGVVLSGSVSISTVYRGQGEGLVNEVRPLQIVALYRVLHC